MTQVATTASRTASSSSLWRRLHSLSGILPVGLFLLYHIYENMTALRGPKPYNVLVNDVNALLPRPYFYVLEVTAILGPLLETRAKWWRKASLQGTTSSSFM